MNEVSAPNDDGDEVSEVKHSDQGVMETQQSADETPLIEARDVAVIFDDQVVLQEINLQITRGQTVAIIGESGCGKTVFMKTLVGLVQPTRGEIYFDGEGLHDMGY